MLLDLRIISILLLTLFSSFNVGAYGKFYCGHTLVGISNIEIRKGQRLLLSPDLNYFRTGNRWEEKFTPEEQRQREWDSSSDPYKGKQLLEVIKVRSVTQESDTFDGVDIEGNIRRFRKEPPPFPTLDSSLYIQELPFPETTSASVDSENVESKVRELGALWKKHSINELAEFLAKTQMNASSTANGARGKNARERIYERFKTANLIFLKKLFSERLITIADIENINAEIATHESGNPVSAAGILRSKNGDGVCLPSSRPFMQKRRVIYEYVPWDEVDVELRKWISRYNRVSKGVGLREVAKLYRDYILIHPTVNGNGRTARILIDGALLKAGFPPLPHHVKPIRNVFFQTDEELFRKFVASYLASSN